MKVRIFINNEIVKEVKAEDGTTAIWDRRQLLARETAKSYRTYSEWIKRNRYAPRDIKEAVRAFFEEKAQKKVTRTAKASRKEKKGKAKQKHSKHSFKVRLRDTPAGWTLYEYALAQHRVGRKGF